MHGQRLYRGSLRFFRRRKARLRIRIQEVQHQTLCRHIPGNHRKPTRTLDPRPQCQPSTQHQLMPRRERHRLLHDQDGPGNQRQITHQHEHW